ncbi:MAG: aspartate/glutamate racemase family protein [Amphiplicatus sp.]
MKLLGLIGGISAESTAIYYRLINEGVRARLGGVHTARLLVWSFDFHLIDEAYLAADWTRYRALVVEAGEALKRAGAEGLLICSNTTHLAAEAVAKATGVPMVHMIDALSAEIERRRVLKPLLFGTPFVMEGDFYRNDMKARFGIETLVPDAADRKEVGRIIFEELVKGEVSASSRARLLAMIVKAKGEGADGVILGCTELSMILSQPDCDIPAFDTTEIHARSAIDFLLGGEV